MSDQRRAEQSRRPVSWVAMSASTSEVESLLATHDAGRRDCSARLWALICFELWMRQWGAR